MTERIEVLLKNESFDAIHADQLWMAPYATRYRKQLKTVLDQHNAVFQIPERLAQAESSALKRFLLNREAQVLRPFEKRTCDEFDQVVWVTARDCRLLNRESDGPSSNVIPICVDPDAQPVLKRSSDPYRVTFVGGMHWPPNAQGIEWFAQDIWPQVVEHVPQAVLTVIGKDAPGSLKRTGSVQVTGYVDDLRPYLAETAVLVVPILAGGGMRVKILDAWCWGLPVASTTIGAEGLEARNGGSILLADSPGEFAEAVIRVLSNKNLAGKLAKEGRSTVENLYNWRSVYQDWERIYQCVFSS
jgi:glycosyltransferase involved in cell wall biosynthesis